MIEDWERQRRDIEKLLWEHYNPDTTPNMEELSEEIMSLLSERTTQAVAEERERVRKVLPEKIKSKYANGADYEYVRGYNTALAHILAALQDPRRDGEKATRVCDTTN